MGKTESGIFFSWQRSAILAAVFLKGCSSCLFTQMPSIKTSSIPFCERIASACSNEWLFSSLFFFLSFCLNTGIMFSSRSNLYCQGFEKKSPLDRKCTRCLQYAAMMMASRNALGWLAVINMEPLLANASLFRICICLQNNGSPSLTNIFSNAYNKMSKGFPKVKHYLIIFIMFTACRCIKSEKPRAIRDFPYLLTHQKNKYLDNLCYTSAAAFTSDTLARILASTSLASSGLSCNSFFTASLPCPSLLLS